MKILLKFTLSRAVFSLTQNLGQYPDEASSGYPDENSWWKFITKSFKRQYASNRSILFFAVIQFYEPGKQRIFSDNTGHVWTVRFNCSSGQYSSARQYGLEHHHQVTVRIFFTSLHVLLHQSAPNYMSRLYLILEL